MITTTNQDVDLPAKSQKRLIWIVPEKIKALEPDQKNSQLTILPLVANNICCFRINTILMVVFSKYN
jgi:hypothetical protein